MERPLPFEDAPISSFLYRAQYWWRYIYFCDSFGRISPGAKKKGTRLNTYAYSRMAEKAGFARAKAAGAVPPWLTQEMREEIRKKYHSAIRKRLLTGKKHAVDHIFPLRAPDGSRGLHVPWNMQVLTGRENSTKYNSVPEHMLNK